MEIYTHLFPYLVSLKSLSSHQYLHIQPNTTGFILAFSLCRFVTPSSDCEKHSSHYSKYIYLFDQSPLRNQSLPSLPWVDFLFALPHTPSRSITSRPSLPPWVLSPHTGPPLLTDTYLILPPFMTSGLNCWGKERDGWGRGKGRDMWRRTEGPLTFF